MSATLTDGRALLRAVIDDPEDTAVRLVYADWLEENGEGERAEFIRVQLRLEGLRREQDEFGKADVSHFDAQRARLDKIVDGLRRRERELLVAHYRDWFRADLGPTVDRLFWVSAEKTYRRGFVESVTLTCADWLAHGPRLVRSAPLRGVRLMGRGPAWCAGLPGGYWRWFEGSPGPRYSSELPFVLWSEYARVVSRAGLSWEHPTEADAEYWLSEACLSWARSTEPTP